MSGLISEKKRWKRSFGKKKGGKEVSEKKKVEKKERKKKKLKLFFESYRIIES